MSTTKRKMSTREVFEAISYSRLNWPGKTTPLGRDTLEDYLQRPGSASVSIAELYHENSKLHRSNAATLLAARTDADQFRHETLQRAASARRVSNRPSVVSIPEKLAAVLRAAKLATGLELFYAVELRLLLTDWLLLWDPSDEAFTVLKQLSEDDLAMLDAALDVIGARSGRQAGSLLFILGWFARNDLLLGARGYRRTLLDAGRALQALASEANALSLGTEVLTEFTDVDIDRVVEADGVEEGTVAVISFPTE